MKNKAFFKIVAIMLALFACATLFACEDKPDTPKAPPSAIDDFDPYPYEDLSVFMDIPQYKGLSIPQSQIDKMMNNALASFCDTYDLYTKTYEGTVKDGDLVDINFIGTMNGVQFEGGTALNYILQIGSDSFIDGFEDGVIGMQVTETKNLNLRFPDNYYPDMAGKDVTFAVTLNAILVPAEITDEICREKTDYQSKDEFLSALKNNCIYNYIWNQLLEKCKLKETIPQQEYTDYYQFFKNEFNEMAQQEGLTLQGFLDAYGDYFSDAGIYSGMTLAQFETAAQMYANSQIINDLLLYSIMRAENIQLKGEEWDAAKAQLKLETGYTYDEMVQRYDNETTAIITVLSIRAKNIIVANTQITDN